MGRAGQNGSDQFTVTATAPSGLAFDPGAGASGGATSLPYVLRVGTAVIHDSRSGSSGWSVSAQLSDLHLPDGTDLRAPALAWTAGRPVGASGLAVVDAVLGLELPATVRANELCGTLTLTLLG